jgi:hypothetical protein
VARDVVVNTDSRNFVVYLHGDKVLALYQGQELQPAENRLGPAAACAMEQASGCPVQAESLEVSGLLVFGLVNCARTNSPFSRARMNGRNGSARGGGRLHAPRLENIEPDSVAAG